MSEHHRSSHEQQHHEKLVVKEQLEDIENELGKRAEQARREVETTDIEQLRQRAESQAESAENTAIDRHQDRPPETTFGVQQLLKSRAYEQTLKRIRQKLPKPARAFSKIAHNKTVDALSAAGAQTVARPSGILGGSLIAFLGSLVLLYYSRHYGFRYNYALFFVLFIGGFVVGVLAEITLWTLVSRKRRNY